MNIRVFPGLLGMEWAGKTDNAQIPGSLNSHLQAKFSPLFFELVEKLGPEFCLYGEGFGGKIQNGTARYGVEQKFVLFDIKVGGWWLRREDVEEIAAQFSIPVVPELGKGTLEDAMIQVKTGLVFSRLSPHPLVTQAEGLVVTPLVELFARNHSRIITKIKLKDFAHLKKEFLK